MLKKIDFLKNSLCDSEFHNKLISNRRYPIPLKKETIEKNIPSSSDEISQICSNNIQSVLSRMKNKNKTKNDYDKFSIYSYQYMKQKASLFVNKNNNQINTIKKISEINRKVSPINKNDQNSKNIIFPTNIIRVNNKNNNFRRQRNLSVCSDNRKNNENNKTIKEIKIKSNKKLSQVFNFNNRYNNNTNNQKKMMTISNLSIIEHNNDNQKKQNKKYLDTPRIGIYSRKNLKPYKSQSMEKKLSNTIASIEIDFGHSIYGNSFTDQKCYNSYKVSKIIMIQRYFRKYLNIKKGKILEGISHLKKYILNNIRQSLKIIFYRYKSKFCKKSGKVWKVKKDQYEMLKILKEKNILGMINLKKYIIKLLNSNKLELF